MKRFHKTLKTALWAVLTLYLGLCVFTCCDYILDPEQYAYTSGPWYLGIEIYGILAAILSAFILLLMLLVKRRMRRSADKDIRE